MNHISNMLPLVFAQQEFGGEDVAVVAVMLVIMAVVLAISLGILALVLYIYYTSLAAIPTQFRTMEPAMVFLLLIPCFGIVWLFFIVTKIPESFRNYFHAMGDHTRGDCGGSVGMWYAGLSVAGMIPYVGALASIPALICMILFLVKLNELKSAVKANEAAGKYPPGFVGAGGYYAGDPKNPYASPSDNAYGPTGEKW